ncbi:Rieske 2Fe-2S domain-containing protein [Lacisediminimonas sp.]|uniref:Rieske 2Fe-2S domain-containing protein n=1 Tax=Lacisediminimonas sp. TaxID=3060582 RepID=UPI0027193786|nr:Rieske 2Fe-2S domain-containing protein [Lacisediminimonas sp.]MDO8300885.1 Rieske 2Fe-2S domain-containing protein [Lacisediminimonas sp.]
MSDNSQAPAAPARSPASRKRLVRPIPAEGENGVYTQSWFPLALSVDVPKGEIVGREFLDGKVVVFRGENGEVSVVSAYCPHVGADLSVGKVVGNNVQCAFHQWEFNLDGVCVKTGIGDPPPPNAYLFKFPVREKFGIVWAFNGETPLFELPEFPVPEDQLEIVNYKFEVPLQCDGWIFSANTPDMQHLKVVHKIQFNTDDPHDLVDWQQYGFDYTYDAVHQGGVPMKMRLGIRGSSFFWRVGHYDGWWRGTVTGYGLPRGGTHTIFGCNAVMKGPDAQKQLEIAQTLSKRTVNEDIPILNTIHYKPGHLTKADKSLARFLNYLRDYPRAHPSRDFID